MTNNIQMAAMMLECASICKRAVEKPSMDTNIESMKELALWFVEDSKKWLTYD